MTTKRVLVVDDEQDILDLMNNILTDEGYEVGTALNMSEAVEILEAMHFELLISDIQMRGGTGLDLLEHVRGNPKFNKMPVALISGHHTSSEEELVHKGANFVFTKPLRIDKFIVQIRDILQ